MHYVLTRAVYSPDRWDRAATKRRLRIFEAVTAASLHAQSAEFQWVLAVHPKDPYLRERLEISGATPVFVADSSTRSDIALNAYKADWPRDGTLTTRLDDDDAFTADALGRIQRAARSVHGRTALIFPFGVRVSGGRYTKVWHISNAMSTLHARDGSIVYDFRHRDVRRFCPVKRIDDRIGWLWVRHDDTLSGWKQAVRPIDDVLRARFPIDWTVLPSEPQIEPKNGGSRFT
jgi:hypothetical protein